LPRILTGHQVRFSVVIPTYNRRDSLRECLAAVTRQDYPDYEVVVVDDGCADGTGPMVQREFPSVRYLRQRENCGDSVARNRAIRESTAECLAFTDDDCVPPRNWLGLHARYYADARIGAVGGPLQPRAPSFYDKVSASHYPEEYDRVRRVEHIMSLERLITGNMSVPRRVIDAVGLFDEQFVTGADVDLVRRISRAGFAFVRDPGLSVEHLKTYTLRSFLAERFRKASGSVITDVKEGTLRVRRFVPVLNVLSAWQDWRNLRAMFGAPAVTFAPFWVLAVAMRWVDVAGRAYYYWTVGRTYQLPPAR
jgi:GT2 family glycosyltransferase